MTRVWLAIVALVTGFMVTVAHAAEPQVTEGFINAPVGDVWRIFTTAEGFKATGVAHAEVDLRIGGAIRSSDEFNQTDGADYDLIVPGETIVDVFAGYRTKFGSLPADISLNLINLTDEINDVTRSDGFMVRAAVEFKL